MVDATDFDGCTALHHAAKSGSCRVVELLLAASPTLLDVVDKDGCTALLYAVIRQHGAASKHHFETASLLLAAKPRNIRASASSDWHVLHYCASRYDGHAETVEKILAIDPGLVRTLTAELQTPLWLMGATMR